MEENLFYKEKNFLLKKILELEGSRFEHDTALAQSLRDFTALLFEKIKCLNCKLRFDIDETFGIEFQSVPPFVVAFKSWRLQALHKHYNNRLSAEENEILYRKCSRLHGHDYKLSLEAEPQTFSGEILGLKGVFREVELNVLPGLKDHVLNDIIGNTSGETLLLYIFHKIKINLPQSVQYRLVLQETYRNSFSLNYKS